MEPDSPTKTEPVEEKEPAAETKEEEKKPEPEPMETDKPIVATTPTAAIPSTSATDLVLTSSRNELLKDIESHIEIIYECLDELNETGSSSSLNKTISSDVITISSEVSSQETEITVKDATEDGKEQVVDPPAQEESKTEWINATRRTAVYL